MTDLLPYGASIALDGPDAVILLERLVTCRVDDMQPGDTRPGALLTPQGKVIADFIATRTETGFTLAVAEAARADLEKRLKMFRLRADVEISSQAGECAHDESARLSAGRPAFGLDFEANEVFPTDINLDLVGGIDYKKGCFIGQEVVSRMKRRGKIRKRTLALEGAGLAKGADVMAGERRLGQVTSAADGQGLALIRLDHLGNAEAADTPLTVGGETAQLIRSDWLDDALADLAEASAT